MALLRNAMAATMKGRIVSNRSTAGMNGEAKGLTSLRVESDYALG